MSKLFTERIPYKPFEFPDYYNEGWLKQMQAFWLHTEIPMQGDVKDWKESLKPHEKHLVGNILLGFAQTECAVSDYWTGMVTKWFPKHEIREMAMAFGSQETIHSIAYSYLNETLGLENFEGFLHDETMKERFELLTNTTADWTPEDLKKNSLQTSAADSTKDLDEKLKGLSEPSQEPVLNQAISTEVDNSYIPSLDLAGLGVFPSEEISEYTYTTSKLKDTNPKIKQAYEILQNVVSYSTSNQYALLAPKRRGTLRNQNAPHKEFR